MAVPSPRRKYATPPLVEAVIEFQFEPRPNGWDSVYFGKMHLQVQEEFPTVETLSGAHVKFGDKTGISLGPAPELKRFIRADGGAVVTVAPDLLGLSVLPQKSESGHPGWDWMRTRALGLLSVYNSVVGPKRIRRIGVRYINAIPITPGEFKLRDVLAEESGVVPPVLLDEQKPFSFRVERVIGAGANWRHVQVLQIAASAVGPDLARLVLDVDQVLTGPHPVEPGVIGRKLDELHEHVHEVFETAVREQVLKSFGPVEAAEKGD